MDWIPSSSNNSDTYSKHDKIKTTLQMKIIYCKMGNVDRDVIYLKVLHPDCLICINEFTKTNCINLASMSLPFWHAKDTDECIIKILKKNCKLSEIELAADLLMAEGEFKVYNGKKTSGF